MSDVIHKRRMTSRVDGTVKARPQALQERWERMHALRRQVPRSSHGFCEFADRTDPVELLERQAATRLPDLQAGWGFNWSG